MAGKKKLSAEEWKALEHAEWRGAVGEKLENMEDCLLDVKRAVFGNSGKGLLERTGRLEAKVKGLWALIALVATAGLTAVGWLLKKVLS